MSVFSAEESERYARQMLLRELGPQGQAKLRAAKVLIIGAGGLGSPAGLYLAAAGVGTLGLCDGDTVERSNLQRQILHDTPHIGRPKCDSAAETISRLNPNINLHLHKEFATEESLPELIHEYDFLLDGTDDFEIKFQINDACVRAGKAFSHAGLRKFEGQLTTWVPGGTEPCYRCVFRAPPPPMATCQQGVLGVSAGVVGCLQALEAIKFLTGMGNLLTGTLLQCDLLAGTFRRVPLPAPDPHCLCQTNH